VLPAQIPIDATPLPFAARFGIDSLVNKLIEGDVDVEFHGLDDRSPLSRATEKGQIATAKLLLIGGASPQRASPLSWAVMNVDNWPMVEVLLATGAPVDSPRDGKSSLW
jgi:ankyrin repeat protein